MTWGDSMATLMRDESTAVAKRDDFAEAKLEQYLRFAGITDPVERFVLLTREFDRLRALEPLTVAMRDLALLEALQGRPAKEIAAAAGLSEPSISRIKGRAERARDTATRTVAALRRKAYRSAPPA